MYICTPILYIHYKREKFPYTTVLTVAQIKQPRKNAIKMSLDMNNFNSGKSKHLKQFHKLHKDV